VISLVPKTRDFVVQNEWLFDYQEGPYGVGYSAEYTIKAPFKNTQCYFTAPEAKNSLKHRKISETVTGQAFNF
jgi:hypothetical protein